MAPTQKARATSHKKRRVRSGGETCKGITAPGCSTAPTTSAWSPKSPIAPRRGGAAHSGASAVDGVFCALAGGTDGLDLPRLLAFACELDEIVAASPAPPAAISESFGDAEVERERKIANDGDG